ncbi:hypothetical protein ACIHAX_33695 [Nocardia sp. NPDC051929]|uniref:hypothetical protein n=1 Tax=Nocardia sp. NPDC051929 TaxID=3364327 RepID=UPI0037CABF3B
MSIDRFMLRAIRIRLAFDEGSTHCGVINVGGQREAADSLTDIDHASGGQLGG